MSPNILPISYVTEVTFYDFKFQICYTTSNYNSTDFICYRILSPSGYSHSFGLDINNPFINDNLRKNYSNLNENNEYLYDNYLKSLIDKSINEYFIPIVSIPFTPNSHLQEIQNNLVTDSSSLDHRQEEFNNNNELTQNEQVISNENLRIDNILFGEFRQNAENFLEDLYFLHSIPLNFQNHLKDIVYQTIWVVYETIVNIPDNYWEQDEQNIIRLTNTEFDKILTHEKLSNKLLEKLNHTDNMCSICLDTIDYNQKTTILKCNHIFHYDCAKMWFTSKCHQITCPYCRLNIKKNNNVTSETYFT